MNIILPFMMLLLAQSQKGQRSSPETKQRISVKGKSGRTWFVTDSFAGASRTPVRDVFANPTGNELVITFALMAGGIRARMFVAPSTLSQIALSDFDVSTFKAAGL